MTNLLGMPQEGLGSRCVKGQVRARDPRSWLPGENVQFIVSNSHF